MLESGGARNADGVISPDIATCTRCLRDLDDPRNGRYRYPFTNCTNCGPRFTIVESMPYDRERTSMASFELCSDCVDEYLDPLDRRYHAEATACPRCGPRLTLVDPSGCTIAGSEEAVEQTRRMLAGGGLVAIKGLGGFHLACDATSDEAALRLRRAKGRPERPMAVMCRDLAAVRAYCKLSASEAKALTSPCRPILLLSRRSSPRHGVAPVSRWVTQPGAYLGVMLPYTPLHTLLLAAGRPAVLVMTSGNASEHPIVADNREAIERLGPMVDGLLVNDRPVVNRCDDSVGSVQEGRLVLIRRSRGFVPLPVMVDRELAPTLAVGAMLSAAFALARGRRVFLSQHIGDADNLETLDFMREAIGKLGRCLRIEPEIVAHDMHPDLPTTHLAGEMAGASRTVAVQHHHAHLVSAMAAAGLTEECQGLVLDGTGWGPDGTIWGGEILVGSASGYRRAGHLRRLPLPGGDAGIRRPIRIAVAYLHVLVPDERTGPLDLWRRARPDEVSVVRRLVDTGFNTPMTSSAGRLFDAVSSLLNVRDEISYEGQAAIELEHLARVGRVPRGLDLHMDVIDEGDEIVLDPGPLVAGLVAGLAGGSRPADLAAGFHAALAAALAESCARVRERGGPQVVVLCGGVYQNRILTRMTQRELRRRGLVPVPPAAIPVGDGGLALGQVLVANAREG